MLHFLCSHFALIDGVLRILFISILTQISICDIRTMRIPDRLNLAVLVIGLLRRGLVLLPSCVGGGAAAGWQGFAAAVLGGLLAAALPMYLIAAAFPGSIGGGDIKLTGAGGVFLGAGGVLRGTGAGVTAAGLYAAVCLIARKKTARQTFALGPFLAMGFLFQMMCSS